MEKAESLLHSVESASNAVGLHLNEGKTKALLLNMGQNKQHQDKDKVLHWRMFLISSTLDHMYPDSFLDFKSRKAQAWKACNTLEKIWKSNLNRQNKINVFRSLRRVYPSIWVRNMDHHKNTGGSHRWMLHTAITKSFKHKLEGNIFPTKLSMANYLPITSKIKARRLSFAGHCLRTADQPSSTPSLLDSNWWLQ